MGKAKHPHDVSRPEPAAIRRAIEKMDMAALKLALTVRQRRFCEEYILDFNGKAACIRAGYSTVNAEQQAHILRKHKGVATYIDHLLRSRESKIMAVDADYLLRRLTDIINKEDAKDSDVLRGLELYMRHKGMFTDKTEITGKDGGAIEVDNRRIEQEAQSFTLLMKSLKDRADKEKPSVN